MEAALPSREAELEAQLAAMEQQLAQLKAQLPASSAGASASPPDQALASGGSAFAPAALGSNATTIMSVEAVNGTINAVQASKGKGSKGKGRAANGAPTAAASSARAPQSGATNGGADPAKTRSKGTGRGSKPKRGYLATDVFDRLTSPTRLSGPAAAIYKQPEPQRRSGDRGTPQGGAQASYAVERPAERPHPFIKSKPKKKKKKKQVDAYGVPKVTKRPHPFLSAPGVKVSVFDRLSAPAKGGAGRPSAAVYSNLSPERAGIHRRPNEAVAASRGSPQATFASSATGGTDAREHLKAMKAAAAGRPSPSPAKASTAAGTPQADRTNKKKKKADPYDVLKPARRPHPLLDTDSPYRATRRGQLVLKAPSLSPPRPFCPPKDQKHAALDQACDERSHAWAERQALLRKSPIPVTRSGAAEVGSSDDSSGSGDSDADDAVSFESEAGINALHAKLRDAIDRYRDGEPAHADANEGLHAMATEMPSKLLSHAPSDKSWPNPLVYAVTQRKVGATMALLESGAKPTALGGRTLLHVAVDTPEPSMKLLDALLEFGQDVNAKDTAQNTPLLLAVAVGASEAQLAAQELLLECGADPKATNAEGKSVTMLASPELLEVLREVMGDDIATDCCAEVDDGDDTILPLPSSVDGDGESLDLADTGYPLPPPLPRRPSRGGSEHIYEFDADSHVSPAVAVEEQKSFLDSIAAFGAELDDDDDDVYEAVVAGLGTAPQADDTYEVPVSPSNPVGRYEKIDYEEIDDGPTKPDYEPMDEDEALYEAPELPARGSSVRDWALPKPPAEITAPPPVAQEEGLSPAELARRKRAAKKAAAEVTASNAKQQAFVDSVSTFGDSGGDVPPVPPPRHYVTRSASVASSQSPLGFMEHNPDYEHAGTTEPVSPALKDADGFAESMGETQLRSLQASLATKEEESVRLAGEAMQMRVQCEAAEGASLAEVATTEQKADALAAERRRWSTEGPPVEHASSTAEEVQLLKESLELQQVQMQLAAAKSTTLAAEKAQLERDAQLERERQATEAAADAERYRQEIATLQKSREGEKADYDRKLAESSRASAEQARAEAAQAEKDRAAEELTRVQKLHEEGRLALAKATEDAQREKAQVAEKMARENAEALEKQRASSELELVRQQQEFERQALEHERREADRVSTELAEMKALHEERERMATETAMIKAEQEREKAAALAELEVLRAQAEAERVEREKQALQLQALKDEQAREQAREAKVEAELAALKAQKVQERQEREKAAAQAEELERQRARQKEEEAQAAAEISRQQAESDRIATELAAAQLAQERAKYEAEAEAARLRAADETASLRAELKEQERQVAERAAQAAAAREAAQAANLAQEKEREERLAAEMAASRAEKEGIAAELAATRLESQRSRDEASAEIERLQAAQRASEIKAEKQAEQRLAAEKATAMAAQRDKEALATERAAIMEAAQQERERLAAEEASIVTRPSSRPPSGIIDSDSDDGEKSDATLGTVQEVVSLAPSSSDEDEAAPRVPSADLPGGSPTPQDDETAQAQLVTAQQPSTTSEDALGQARRKLADAMKRAQTTVSSGKARSATVQDALARAQAKRNSMELKLSSDGIASKHSDAIARAQARRAATAAAAAGGAGAKQPGTAKAGPSGDLYSDDSDTDSVSSAGRSPAKSPAKPAGTDPADRKAAVREVALARAKAKRAEILAKVKRGEGSRAAAGSR